MASLSRENNIEATIPSTEQNEGVTLYIIILNVGAVRWSVKQRYNAFADLHDKLVSNHGVARDLLPPKKIIGNKDPTFIERRRADLELYLQTIINFMHHALPRELAEFLDFQHYELTHLLQSLARYCFLEGEKLLHEGQPVSFTPLQLHAISYRLKNPLPTNVASEQETDFSHVVDFISQVRHLVIEGSNQCLRCLEKCPVTYESGVRISELEKLYNKPHSTITIILANKKAIKEAVVAKGASMLTEQSSQILEDVERLLLVWINQKRLRIRRVFLTFSFWGFSFFFWVTLPRWDHLDLSQNSLSSLKGLSKLYSLSSLNVSTNNICEISEVSHLSRLPCLETLILTGNPVATIVDYRTKVLELFGQRASEICLDNERPTQRELEFVAVLQAIRASREGRLPTLSISSPLPITSGTLSFVPPDLATAVSESSSN
ncbi:nischarin-like [Cherax quadricarinatus]|uniref:nischarin-like n=1 Tax=Cherax quadricarinatus TaxID=27406 RepID=UPI00387E7A9C